MRERALHLKIGGLSEEGRLGGREGVCREGVGQMFCVCVFFLFFGVWFACFCSEETCHHHVWYHWDV